VRTAPAKIRLIREGDNPWLEVTIIEGRNRQVRKMFEEVGHHVEKIRRVQYGPLILDVPPGDWRNLTLLEVAKLKTAASGIKSAKPVAQLPKQQIAQSKQASEPFRERPVERRASSPVHSVKTLRPPVQASKPAFAAPSRSKTSRSAAHPTRPHSGQPSSSLRGSAARRSRPSRFKRD
jgi:23S rRNA pseudouridine2605 synthase